MYAAQADDLPLMTKVEYLAFADAQAVKYEYRQGRVYAMTGASVRHNNRRIIAGGSQSAPNNNPR